MSKVSEDKSERNFGSKNNFAANRKEPKIIKNYYKIFERDEREDDRHHRSIKK